MENKFKGNRAYILKGGRYVLFEGSVDKGFNKEYFTAKQAERINNLLMAKKYIDNEINLIKDGKYEEETEQEVAEPKDELISNSGLSNRAKNVFFNMKFKNLSDIAKYPFSKWSNWRNMGAGTIEETKKYLIKHGFILNEK